MLPGTCISPSAENLQLIHLFGNMRCVALSETCIEILKVVRLLNHRGVARSPQLGKRVDLHPWWYLPIRVQARGKKSKATVQLKELPQGVLKLDNSFADWKDEGPAYPTVVQQARNNMRTFSNCVLLTRVGGFYEVCMLDATMSTNCVMVLTNVLKLYFEHAEKYGPLLNLKVAQKKTTAGPVSMVCPTFLASSPVF